MDENHYFNLVRRYQNSTTEYEKKPYSQHELSILDIKVEDVLYERPYWVAPDLSGPHGNNINLINIVKDTLYKNGFSDEANEFQNLALKITKQTTSKSATDYLVNIINQFVDYENAIKSKVINGETYINIKEQIKDLQQLPEFKNVNLETVKKLHEKNFDFSTQNTYGRSILFYVKDKKTMEYIFDNVYDINNVSDYLKMFKLDVFQSSLLIKHEDPEILDFILGKMLSKEKDFGELIKKWCLGVDSFSRCMEDSIVKNLNNTFGQKTNAVAFTYTPKKLQNISNLLGNLLKINPEFINATLIRGKVAFQNDKEKLEIWNKYIIQGIFDTKLPEKDEKDQSNKKFKV